MVMLGVNFEILKNVYVILTQLSAARDTVKELEEAKTVSLTLTLMIQPISDELFDQCLLFLLNVLDATSLQPKTRQWDRVFARSFDVLMQVRAHAQELDGSDYTANRQQRLITFIAYTKTCDRRLRAKLQNGACILLCQFDNEQTCVDVIEKVLKLINWVTFELYEILHFLQSGYLPCIVQYTTHTSANIRHHVISIVGHILTESNDMDVTMMRSSLFNHVAALLMSDEVSARELIAWMLANVTVGTAEVIDSLCNCYLWPTTAVLLQSTNRHVVRDSLWVVLDFLVSARDEQKHNLLQNDRYGVVSALLCLLSNEVQPDINKRLVLNIFYVLLQLISNSIHQEPTADVSCIVAQIGLEFSKAYYTQINERYRYYTEKKGITVKI